MKTLTLTQPYADLIANGDKRVETRSWSTEYRGPLLIHAAATLKGVGGKNGYIETLHHLPDEALLRLGRNARLPEGQGVPPGLPLGAIVAVSYLDGVERIDAETRHGLATSELGVGNYADGRYAWFLRKALPVPALPWRGALGLWEFPDEEMPDYLLRACRAIKHAVQE